MAIKPRIFLQFLLYYTTHLCCCSLLMIVDGKRIPFWSNSTITYSPDRNKQGGPLSNTVQVTAVDISHPSHTDALKVGVTASVEKSEWPFWK